MIDETGLFLNPLVKRSWARIGQTPVIAADGGHRDKVSVIGAVSVSPTNHHLGFYFATEPDGFFTTDKVIEFLKEVLKIGNRPVSQLMRREAVPSVGWTVVNFGWAAAA